MQLLLADDLAAVASSAVALQLFMRHLEAACQRWGLVISGSKTECLAVDPRQQQSPEWWRRSLRCQHCHGLQPEASMLVCSACDSGWHTGCLQPPLAEVPDGDWQCPACDAAAVASGGTVSRETPVCITVAGQPVAWVRRFKYLGSQFSSDGGLDAELMYRSQQAANAFKRLHKPVWRQRCVQLSTKMRIYRSLVSSVLLYGAHSWALTAAQLERLEVVQRKQLRQIVKGSSAAPPVGSEPPRHISNTVLMATCAQPSIEMQLLRQRGCWVGHILRMPDCRMAKQLFFGDIVSSAPAQSRMPPSLLSMYAADVSAMIPRSELRRLCEGRPDLFEAAASKSQWNNYFSISS